jgi:hypothetical protein
MEKIVFIFLLNLTVAFFSKSLSAQDTTGHTILVQDSSDAIFREYQFHTKLAKKFPRDTGDGDEYYQLVGNMDLSMLDFQGYDTLADGSIIKRYSNRIYFQAQAAANLEYGYSLRPTDIAYGLYVPIPGSSVSNQEMFTFELYSYPAPEYTVVVETDPTNLSGVFSRPAQPQEAGYSYALILFYNQDSQLPFYKFGNDGEVRKGNWRDDERFALTPSTGLVAKN